MKKLTRYLITTWLFLMTLAITQRFYLVLKEVNTKTDTALGVINIVIFLLICTFGILGIFKKKFRSEMFMGGMFLMIISAIMFINEFQWGYESYLYLIIPGISILTGIYLLTILKKLKINFKKTNKAFIFSLWFIIIEISFLLYKAIFYSDAIIKIN